MKNPPTWTGLIYLGAFVLSAFAAGTPWIFVTAGIGVLALVLAFVFSLWPFRR